MDDVKALKLKCLNCPLVAACLVLICCYTNIVKHRARVLAGYHSYIPDHCLQMHKMAVFECWIFWLHEWKYIVHCSPLFLVLM